MKININEKFLPALVILLITATSCVTAQTEIQDVASPYMSQWAGGCYQDCGRRNDSFCNPIPVSMCYDCRMYCQREETYFSLKDCQTNCPAHFAATWLTTEQPTLENTKATSSDSYVTPDVKTKGTRDSTNISNSTSTAATTHQKNDTTPRNITATPRVGKPSLRGGWIIVVIGGVILVLAVGMYIYCKNMRTPSREVPKQTAKCEKHWKVLQWGLCFHPTGDQGKEYRGVQQLVHPETNVESPV